MMIDVVVY